LVVIPALGWSFSLWLEHAINLSLSRFQDNMVPTVLHDNFTDSTPQFTSCTVFITVFMCSTWVSKS
jgi:hypothetical protein